MARGVTLHEPRPLSDERVQINAAGPLELKLTSPWRDATTHLVMSPLARHGLRTLGNGHVAVPAPSITSPASAPRQQRPDLLCERQRTHSKRIYPHQAIAVGAGANDLPIMAVADLSVACHAKPRVLEQAMVAIDSGGLDRLLEVVTPA